MTSTLRPVEKILFSAACLLILVMASCQPQNIPVHPATKSDWVKIGPGGGGATFIPTFSVHNPDEFLIRCDMTGSYHTENGGKTFQQINFPNGANSYAFDPLDKNKIYIGSASLNRSLDGGKSWVQLFPDTNSVIQKKYEGDHATFSITTNDSSFYPKDFSITSIRIDPKKNGSIYFTMGASLFSSIDDGKTFIKSNLQENAISLYTDTTESLQVYTDMARYEFNKISHTLTRYPYPQNIWPVFSLSAGKIKNSDSLVIYALHHDQQRPIDGEFGFTEVWRSLDNAATWQKIEDSLVTNKSSHLDPSYSMIACAEEDASSAYLVSNRYLQKQDGKERYWYGAMKTGNAGKSWNWVWKGGGGSGKYGLKDGTGVKNLTDAWAEKAFGGEYIRLMDVGVSPKDGNIAMVTDWYRPMKTMDGGKSWTQVYSQPQPDGSYTSNGIDVTSAYGVHFDPFDSSHIAISYTDIGYHHSYNNGKSWQRSANGVPAGWINTCYWIDFDPEVKDKLWSVWSGFHDFPRGKMTRNPKWKDLAKGGVCLSVDGGKTWTPFVNGMGENSPATSIIIDKKSPANNRTLYATVYNKGVFKSTDDGKSWSLKNKGIDENISAFEITIAGNGTLYLTVSATPAHKDGKKGREFYSGEVYKSVDAAETWTKLKVTGGLLFPNGIGIDPKDPNRLFLACWADIDLADLVGGDVARTTGGNELLKMKGGIFLSEDAGVTWKQVFDEHQYVYDVTADEFHPGRFYCNTFNGAAYRSDDNGINWKKIKDYDFHWGQRVIVDNNDTEKIYLTTFGSSVLHGNPLTD